MLCLIVLQYVGYVGLHIFPIVLAVLRGRSEEVAEASNSSDSPVVAILPDQSVSATTSVQNSGRKATSVRRGLFCTPNEDLDNDDRIDDWIDESGMLPCALKV